MIMNDVRPLKAPVEIKDALQFLPVIILVLLLASAIAGFFYFKKKRHVKEKPIEPPRPPEETAFEELRSLIEARLVEKGMIKEYYIRISDIIRKYIERKYNVLALDKTTWELYRELRAKNFNRAHADMIRDFLEDCDLVKFAKYAPAQKEIEEIYARAKEIVAVTSQQCIAVL